MGEEVGEGFRGFVGGEGELEGGEEVVEGGEERGEVTQVWV